MLPEKLHNKLKERLNENALRVLSSQVDSIDFFSNDYLGFSKSAAIFEKAGHVLVSRDLKINGATGSRLLSGNHALYIEVETKLCNYHESEAALIFNSGYDANIGFFSSVLQKEDIVLYDEYIHASIRDGIRMSHAKAYKFKHNDNNDLKEKLSRLNSNASQLYVVTESVFSMDGDIPDLVTFSNLCDSYENVHLIVDEAHAIGIFEGGLIQQLKLSDKIFARIITFGKALGCHGAAILCTQKLKEYLVNFARSFIYTTALPPHALATILAAYNVLENDTENRNELHQNITFFNTKIEELKLRKHFIESKSAIQCCVVSGNEKVKAIAHIIKEKGFAIKPILSPTVPKGKERLRFCLHSFNSKEEIESILNRLRILI